MSLKDELRYDWFQFNIRGLDLFELAYFIYFKKHHKIFDLENKNILDYHNEIHSSWG